MFVLHGNHTEIVTDYLNLIKYHLLFFYVNFSGINYLLLDRLDSFVLAEDLQLGRELGVKEEKDAPFLPEIPPSGSPFPLYPSIAPSPLSSFVNISTPKLSGHYMYQVLFFSFIFIYIYIYFCYVWLTKMAH